MGQSAPTSYGGGGSFVVFDDFRPMVVGGGGGRGSYVYHTASEPFTDSGVNAGNGYISITLEAAPPVPEPSTWALIRAGFAGLGFLGLRRGRKPEPSKA
jgi:hypothetical protein